MTRLKTTATVEIPAEDNPAVLAYRVGKLEEAVTGGFNDVKEQLSDMSKTFATQVWVSELQREGEKAHDDLQKQIDDIKRNAKFWVGTILTIAGIAVAIFAVLK